MKYQFVDTVAAFTVDGKEFTLDIGERDTVKKAETLNAACFGDENIFENIKGAVAELFDQETADSMFANISPTNDVKARHLGLSLAHSIVSSRASMVMSAFKVDGKAAGTPKEGGDAE